jgi:hypothetical protein
MYVCEHTDRHTHAIFRTYDHAHARGTNTLRVQLDAGVSKCPGMYLGGNYISGVAFGDCVQWGVDTAPKIAAFLASEAPAANKASV